MKKVVLLFAMLLGLSGISSANCGNNNGNGNGCSDEQGPAGPTGPQGPAGENGSNGANGTNGTDGKDGANGAKGDKGAPGTAYDDSAKLVVDSAIRLYDGKRVQWQIFDVYALDRRESHDVLGGGRNVMFGTRFVFKLGTSYEERLLAKQSAEIAALRAQLAK